ncbi:MAG: hypothetical protein U0S48_18230 [Solirubrobacteraceae bacterium]
MTSRDAHGRWRSGWRTWELPELVHQVAVEVLPDRPEALGSRRYDRERKAVGFLDAPTANAVRDRLRAPSWPILVETIFSETADVFQEIWRWREGVVRGRFTERDATEAVRTVAAFLDQRSVHPGEYAYARLELQARDTTGRAPLPTLRQLMYYGGSDGRQGLSWNSLLSRAGLDRAETRPSPGLTSVEALDACVSAHGTLPTKRELRRFVRANRLSMVDGRDVRMGEAQHAELRRQRARRGLTTPDAPPPIDERPDYDAPVPAERIPANLRRSALHRHTSASALAAMHAFLNQLPDELTPVAIIYNEFALRTDGAPGQGVLVGLGGFARVRDAALSERVTNRRNDGGVQSAAAHPYNAGSVTSKRPPTAKQTSRHPVAEEF